MALSDFIAYELDEVPVCLLRAFSVLQLILI